MFWATELTKIPATLFAVYGIFMSPIGWGLAAFVWGYALLSFLITDQLKIYFFRLMRHEEALSSIQQPYVISPAFPRTLSSFLKNFKKLYSAKNEDI
jgi:hypothetical protein